MNINDILNSSGDEVNDEMDMDVSLNYENPELMSSEFFDSVLSLENNLEDGFFPGFDDDLHLSSSDTSCHTDEVLSPGSFYSESERSSTSENIDESASVLSGLDGCDVPMLMSFLDPVQNIQLEAQTTTPIAKSQKPTKILIQNPNNKKIITKPLLHANQLKKNLKVKPQILKVQSVSNSGRPVLLPLSVKSIKILNSNAELTSLTGSLKRRKVVQTVESAEDDDTHVVSSTQGQYPAVALTSEEKRLLSKEGIQLPTHHPLTKNEERELKRIRRKIRNKISAQDSRKRKKEYVDGLEERVKRGSEENKNLLQRVKELQRQNKNLLAHVSKLQALICKSTTSKATPSTCLMVVLLSALLVSLPNIRLFENKQMSSEQEQVAIRRTLLSSQQATEDDALNMEEFLVFKDEDVEFDGKFGEEVLDIENSTDKDFTKLLEEVGKKYDGVISDKNSSNKNSMFSKVVETIKHFLDKDKPEWFGNNDYGGYNNKRGFIEPDIDDDPGDGPVIKKMRFVDDFDVDSIALNNEIISGVANEKIVSTTVTTNNFGIKNSKDK